VSGTGTVAFSGSIDTSGINTPGVSSAAGGAVSIDTNNGTISIAAVTTSGGNGNSSISGGNAGNLEVNTGVGNSITLAGNITALGGSSTGRSGGTGGVLNSNSDPVIIAETFVVDTTGGAGSTDARRGTGGNIIFGNLTINGGKVLNAVTITTTNEDSQTNIPAITVSGETSGTGTVAASGSNFKYTRSGNQNIFSGSYNIMTLSGSGTKTFSGTTIATGGITVDAGMIVTGGGAANTFVQAHATAAASATSRVFTISANTVTISNMTVRYGKTADSNGGGILFQGDDSLTITDTTVSNNTVTGDDSGGGGIANGGDGTINITNSTISGNTATGDYALGGG